MDYSMKSEEQQLTSVRTAVRPDFENHPCFSMAARHTTGRIHLPVAPKCNIQCNFCNRKYDCMNESRPGVTSTVLSPSQSLRYLTAVLEKVPNIAVVGIAGPGDPFANAAETLETLDMVGTVYPEKLLCLATNGLELAPYVERIAKRNVSHVTVTVNAVDSAIGAQIYSWVRKGAHVYHGNEAAEVLLDSQTEAIRLLHEHHITVKINTVIIPGVNDTHAAAVAEYTKSLGADIQNCIPLVPVEGAVFSDYAPPSTGEMQQIRTSVNAILPQMCHCARCRADAVGMLGEENSAELQNLLIRSSQPVPSKDRPYIAVTTREGLFVNEHLGEADSLWIYGVEGYDGSVENPSSTDMKITFIERRPAPAPGEGNVRWEKLAGVVHDCYAILSSGCGDVPQQILSRHDLPVLVMEGLITDGLNPLFAGVPIPAILQRPAGACGMGKGCGGNGMGC